MVNVAALQLIGTEPLWKLPNIYQPKPAFSASVSFISRSDPSQLAKNVLVQINNETKQQIVIQASRDTLIRCSDTYL